MSCITEKQLIDYVTGELAGKKADHIREHLNHCPQCDALHREMLGVDGVLRHRNFPPVPAGLARRCIDALPRKDRVRGSIGLDLWTGVRSRRAVQWAFVVLVFFIGLGTGKLIFQQPTWAAKYGNQLKNGVLTRGGDNSQIVRNYLLSVETLLLDLSNMNDAKFLNKDEWKLEMEVTREVMAWTGKLKETTRDRYPELHHLVTEIEWVLEEVLVTPSRDLAGFSRDVQRSVEELRLLPKIHNLIANS